MTQSRSEAGEEVPVTEEPAKAEAEGTTDLHRFDGCYPAWQAARENWTFEEFEAWRLGVRERFGGGLFDDALFIAWGQARDRGIEILSREGDPLFFAELHRLIAEREARH